MDRFREVSASEKERKPAGEESGELPSTSSGILTLYEEECRDLEAEISSLKEKLEVLKSEANRDEQSAKLPSTSSGRLTRSEEECRRLETEISWLEDYLRFMKIILDVAVLLLTTLGKLTGEQLKTFQSKLTSVQLLGFPPIPESQLENADRQDIVDQMVKRYGPESAVGKTQRILRGMDQNDLAKKLKRDYNRALLLATLEELTEEQLKTFQYKLTRGLLPGFLPIPKSQLKKADRQVTVGQMVKRYGSERAVENTQRILRGMDQNDLAEKLEIDYRHRRETWWSNSSDADSDEESENKLYWRKWHRALVMKEEAASEMERKPAGEESGELPSTSSGMPRTIFSQCGYPPGPPPPSFLSHLGSCSGSSGLLRSQRTLAVPALLLTTLEEMNPQELKTFQSFLTSGLLPDCPPIPESQLENADIQVIVGQMVKTYGPERAVEITLRILRGMKRVDLAEKLETDHRGGTASTSHLPLFPPRPRSVLSPVWLPPISPLLSRSSPSFGSSKELLWLTSAGSSGQFRSQETPKLEMDCPPILDIPLEMANSVNTEVAVNTQENIQRMDEELGREG
ncbi:uncharacterized protein LOC123489769 [Coregonus clupeaformis]|uniref:uncharacterized protein LOC123489769 n=1 Tax=Coregonus clupeaformis TaxID=59861 RepID=UPI001E1C308A|nr:uncharacterized protein LOC123489769 [Coregonus clupeaformis]